MSKSLYSSSEFYLLIPTQSSKKGERLDHTLPKPLNNLFYIVTKMVILKNKKSRAIIEKLRSKREKILSKEEIIETMKDYQKFTK